MLLPKRSSHQDILRLNYDTIKEEFEKGVVPLCLNSSGYKTGVDYRTFLEPEAVVLLKKCFQEKPPALGKPLFPISGRGVQDYLVPRAKEMIGTWQHRNPMSPQSVRKGFRTAIVNDGCVESYAEQFMGHDLDSDLRKTYTFMSDDA